MSFLQSLKKFARDFRVGEIMPSSPFAVRRILAALPERPHAILECGPGNGVITRKLVERLGEGGKVLAIESDPKRIAELAVIHDPRLLLVHGDAAVAEDFAREHGIGPFDAVVSGIPFSLLSERARIDAVAMAHRLLKPGGVFVVYQTSPLMAPYLEKQFAVETSIEPRNVPPYFIMTAVK